MLLVAHFFVKESFLNHLAKIADSGILGEELLSVIREFIFEHSDLAEVLPTGIPVMELAQQTFEDADVSNYMKEFSEILDEFNAFKVDPSQQQLLVSCLTKISSKTLVADIINAQLDLFPLALAEHSTHIQDDKEFNKLTIALRQLNKLIDSNNDIQSEIKKDALKLVSNYLEKAEALRQML